MLMFVMIWCTKYVFRILRRFNNYSNMSLKLLSRYLCNKICNKDQRTVIMLSKAKKEFYTYTYKMIGN